MYAHGYFISHRLDRIDYVQVKLDQFNQFNRNELIIPNRFRIVRDGTLPQFPRILIRSLPQQLEFFSSRGILAISNSERAWIQRGFLRGEERKKRREKGEEDFGVKPY